MSRTPEGDRSVEKQPVLRRLEAVAIGMLGVTEADFLVGDDQWVELDKLCKTAGPLIEQARKGAKTRRIVQKIAKVTTEFATMAMTRALKDPQHISPWLVTGALGTAALTSVLGSHMGNEQQRLDQQALRAVFADMAASPELTGDEDWWRQCQSVWQPEMINMAWANRALNNRPGEMIFWLTAGSVNIGQMYPDLIPTVAAAWGGGVAQILGSAKMFKAAEGKFINAGGRAIDSLSRHGNLTHQEKEEADHARHMATWSTNVINFVTEMAPGLPVIQAVFQGSLVQEGMALAARLMAAQIASGPLRDKLGECIGAANTLTSARQGKEFLYRIIEKWQEAKVRISTDEDWEQHIKAIGPMPETDEGFTGEPGKRLVLHEFVPRRLSGTAIGEAKTATLAMNQIMVIRGESGSGKSSLVESIFQRVKGVTGHAGFAENGNTEWLGTGTIEDRDRKVLFINPGREGGSSFMDRALTEQLQVQILTGVGITVSREFARAGWTVKQVMAQGNEHLTSALRALEAYTASYLKETGLFTESETPEEMMYRNFGEYSEGQRRRLVMAIAGLRPQKLMAFDEPTASLDVEISGGISSTDRVVRYLQYLQEKKGKAVICVIHDDMQGLRKKFKEGLGLVIDVEKEGGWKVVRGMGETEQVKTGETYRDIWNSLDRNCYDFRRELRSEKGNNPGYVLRSPMSERRQRVEEHWPEIQSGMEGLLAINQEAGELHIRENETSRWVNLAIACYSHFDRMVSQKRPDDAFQVLETMWKMTKAIPETALFEYGAFVGVTQTMLAKISTIKEVDQVKVREIRKGVVEIKQDRSDLNGGLLEAAIHENSRSHEAKIIQDPGWEEMSRKTGVRKNLLIYLLANDYRSLYERVNGESAMAKEIVANAIDNVKGGQNKIDPDEWKMVLETAVLCAQGYTLQEALVEWRIKISGGENATRFSRLTILKLISLGLAGDSNFAATGLYGSSQEAVELDRKLLWAINRLKQE